jgi:hypothetical protein
LRASGYGGIAYRHISDTYIALFSHFIPCGVWEAVYVIEGLLRNDSDVQPDTIHADTQGQSLPVFGLAALLGFDLLPRIRNWADLNFYRPSADTGFEHIDSLFGDNVIDWGLIETHCSLVKSSVGIGSVGMNRGRMVRPAGRQRGRRRVQPGRVKNWRERRGSSRVTVEGVSPFWRAYSSSMDSSATTRRRYALASRSRTSFSFVVSSSCWVSA